MTSWFSHSWEFEEISNSGVLAFTDEWVRFVCPSFRFLSALSCAAIQRLNQLYTSTIVLLGGMTFDEFSWPVDLLNNAHLLSDWYVADLLGGYYQTFLP